MKSVKVLTTFEEIKSFSDPYRIIIMKHFYRLDKPATVKQIADEMGEVPAKVHYHVKKMVASSILKLNYTKEINGILAKYYEPTAKTFQIENKDIGKYQFNNQIINLNVSSESDHISCAESIIKIRDHAVYLEADELEDLLNYLDELKEKKKSKVTEQGVKKYCISLKCAE